MERNGTQLALVKIQLSGNERVHDAPPKNADYEDEETELLTDEVEDHVPSTDIANPTTVTLQSNDSVNENDILERKNGGLEVEVEVVDHLEEEEEEEKLDEVPSYLAESRKHRSLTGIKTLLKTSLLDLKLFFWYGIAIL